MWWIRIILLRLLRLLRPRLLVRKLKRIGVRQLEWIGVGLLRRLLRRRRLLSRLPRLPRLRHNARSHPLFISGGRRSLARLIGLAGRLAWARVSGLRVLSRIGRLRHKIALSKQDDSGSKTGQETGSEVCDSLHPMIVDCEEFSQTTSLQKR